MSSSLIKPDGRVLSTLESDGSRRWLTPKLAVGKLFNRRRLVAWGLIVLLTALPLIPINGKPAVLLNVPDRQFTFFGYTFLPTDTILFALLMVSWFATIFLTTAVLGRAWCGWTCPQTVYMEFVYRPIERLFLGRAGVGGKPKAGLSPLRKVGMHLAFVLISLVITHTLLSYLVGVDELRKWITQSPANHPWAFGVIAISSLAVWYNFVFFREQMCIIACPYGRFQSVLLDRNSLVVRYNDPRGEPRGKKQAAGGRQQAAKTVALDVFSPPAASRQPPATLGDCVDCSLCVQVCPTGIDIRDGTQLECINCAQCIDACDAVMTKIGRPTNLIGYFSQAEIEGERTKYFRPRVVLYSVVSFGFLAVMLVLIATKKPFDASLARNFGLPFFTTPTGQVENVMRLTIRNRTGSPKTYSLKSQTPGISVMNGEASFEVPAHSTVVQPINLVSEQKFVPDGMQNASLRVQDETGAQREVAFQFFGPGGQP
ncbi:MAG: cytochrome c oxidase accessory protein CcoG [Tepidisphaeraceae bacterium]